MVSFGSARSQDIRSRESDWVADNLSIQEVSFGFGFLWEDTIYEKEVKK